MSNPFSDQANTEINPYASPSIPAEALIVSPTEFQGLWRIGDTMVMHKMAPLPPVCLKSNEPCTQRLKRNLQWHNPWLGLTILIAVPVYVVIAIIFTQRATIQIGLSDAWLARRRQRLMIAWGIGLGGFILGMVGFVLGLQGRESEGFLILLLPAFIMVFGGLIYGQYACRMVYPERIKGDYIWLKGVNPEFLNRLEVWSYVI